MKSTDHSSRRRLPAKPVTEGLETRALLTGGAGNTIALIPQVVDKPGGVATVEVQVDPSTFPSTRKGSILMGIDVAPQINSQVVPKISKVLMTEDGKAPKRTRSWTREPGATATLVPVKTGEGASQASIRLTTQVVGEKGTAGNLLVGYYLPGDVNGDGVVDRIDVRTIKQLKGINANNEKYSFDADSNRDGRIDQKDLAAARKNLGVRTVVSPVVTAEIDASAIQGQERVTSADRVQFTGVATPGASISYADVNGVLPTSATIVGESGTYAITVPLAEGVNTFWVTTNDPFGQSIAGQIAPVTRKA